MKYQSSSSSLALSVSIEIHPIRQIQAASLTWHTIINHQMIHKLEALVKLLNCDIWFLMLEEVGYKEPFFLNAVVAEKQKITYKEYNLI